MKLARNPLNVPLLEPFLIALFPVISLWLSNADQTPLFSIARPVIYAEVVALIAVTAGLAIYRKAGKAAIFASVFLILFFSYGHVLNLAEITPGLGSVLGRHRFLAPLWLVLLMSTGLLIWKFRGDIITPNRILNIVCLGMVGFAAVQVGVMEMRTRPAVAGGVKTGQAVFPSQPAGEKTYPDIYYIILDGYAREDVLAEQHGIDIHPFVQSLRGLGFSVMDCGQSNYTQTPFSVASTLNMNYLDALGVPLNPYESKLGYEDYTSLISHSLAREKLKALGYQFISFKPLYPWMDIKDSDIYYDVEKSASLFDRQESTEFQYLFLRTTLMRLTVEMEESNPDPFNRMPPWMAQIFNPKAELLSSRNFKQRDENLYEIKVLSQAAMLPGRKFFYLHFFITHPPYMFKPDGGLRWPVIMNQAAYDDQVLYINSQLIPILKGIIQDSRTPPVIILQADHGYHASFEPNRVKILDAYYLPGMRAGRLYPTITPVNTFRMIFNQYFGENYPLLEDKSYFSPKEKPYQFQLVPNTCPVTTS